MQPRIYVGLQPIKTRQVTVVSQLNKETITALQQKLFLCRSARSGIEDHDLGAVETRRAGGSPCARGLAGLAAETRFMTAVIIQSGLDSWPQLR
jgi:hypothetical protein